MDTFTKLENGKSGMVNSAPRYARRAVNRQRTAWVAIKVRHMNRAHADFWHAHFQGEIDRRAMQVTASNLPSPRADAGWNWPFIPTFLPLTQVPQGSRCRALTILVRNDKNQAVPAAMALLIERYPWINPKAPTATSTFTWFTSTAPEDLLKAEGVLDPPSLGRILIDSAIITSISVGNLGQIYCKDAYRRV